VTRLTRIQPDPLRAQWFEPIQIDSAATSADSLLASSA